MQIPVRHGLGKIYESIQQILVVKMFFPFFNAVVQHSINFCCLIPPKENLTVFENLNQVLHNKQLHFLDVFYKLSA